ncbi:unnamed protein product [Prunus armeniaca]|uniref:Uncharacterized protein n=1 Tax=Prunus armeniaca TaxID=36596 RepID=A0A6J5Y8T5_PRUAR|nr:unnamed protein product [Prunus armeniaca]CAB4293887.1 unnamed protein product [Prunus armeniaca]CAB4311017.1 unnamed protein product [Prunus armeniaca]CAB4320335.1 unnamed protein product [Prunus armeniaca]
MSAGNIGDSSLALEALFRGNQILMLEASAIGFVAVTSCFVYWSVLPISWPPTTEEWEF